MPKFELTDEEHAAVTMLLHRTVSDNRFPFSDQIQTLRAALEKLEPATVPKPKAAQAPFAVRAGWWSEFNTALDAYRAAQGD